VLATISGVRAPCNQSRIARSSRATALPGAGGRPTTRLRGSGFNTTAVVLGASAQAARGIAKPAAITSAANGGRTPKRREDEEIIVGSGG
jgi:hypothetical protein